MRCDIRQKHRGTGDLTRILLAEQMSKWKKGWIPKIGVPRRRPQWDFP